MNTTSNPRSITVPQQKIPLLLEADIVVVGGGTTGPFAAISAARRGKKVVMIERFGSLGGNLTLGLNTKPSGALIGGLPLEIWNLARSTGGAGADYMAMSKTGGVKIASPCDPEIMKILLTRLCVESGVQILFETFVSAPVVEDGSITGVIIESKAGRQFISAKVVIDCSADADIAVQAKVPFVMGAGDSDATMQPVSMYYTMNGVDVKRLAEWARTCDDIPARAIPDNDKDLQYGLWLTGFNGMLRQFEADTGTSLQRDNITLKTANGLMYINATRVLGVDIFSPVEFTAAIVECYRQIEAVSEFLRTRVPGFEQAHIGQIAPVLGVRETRHIRGEYTLTGPDALEGKRFEDSIAADASALDIHDPKGGDVDFRGMQPYEIPYGCLVPLGVEQLLVAGRCISADHTAHARSRNMPACMATGQAAGIAAAVALDEGVSVRDVPVRMVQEVLRSIGMPLHAEEIFS
ncbi:FAD-dependent oxidoreductase [Pollutimonas bauzanensis]|uniref:FAD dependent oxidoreductase n=1 Tax=Pollutimonas bauzanensis TaxID=658167 RepID=A0A1M5Z903_9BURK|nr:FAD-dependent oxidoreductase [Pollutimonas bauzanensis]SHI20684.1 FAD dependent oxidoreductase [Pollutimonas bauzanensis]